MIYIFHIFISWIYKMKKVVTVNYKCSKWKDNSTRRTPWQLKCKKYHKTITTKRTENQTWYNNMFILKNYVNSAIYTNIIFTVIILFILTIPFILNKLIKKWEKLYK